MLGKYQPFIVTIFSFYIIAQLFRDLLRLKSLYQFEVNLGFTRTQVWDVFFFFFLAGV